MKPNYTYLPYQGQALAILCLMAALAGSACKKETNGHAYDNYPVVPKSSLNRQDLNFVSKTGMANRALIDLSEVAITKASDSDVRAFALLLVNDYMLEQTELMQVGGDKGITVPDTLDTQHKELKRQMLERNGRSFDSMYIYRVLEDHNYAFSSFNAEIRAGEDDSVQRYANLYLPHVQICLGRAKTIASKF